MAFGARYDGNPDVAFVDIRDYGNSGDCNGDYAGIRNTTLYSFQSNFIAPHVQAVQKTQLIIPWTGAWLEGKPADPVYAWVVSQGVGMRRGGICNSWPKDGSECPTTYRHGPLLFEYGNTWPDTVKDGLSSPEALIRYVRTPRHLSDGLPASGAAVCGRREVHPPRKGQSGDCPSAHLGILECPVPAWAG